MIHNNSAGRVGTANFARAVYFLVTFALLGFSTCLKAQMLDLGDLQKWKYDGSSQVSHKNHGCRFAPGPLKRDPITRRFLQDYQFTIQAHGNNPAVSYPVLQRANIRLHSPSDCPDHSGTCEYSFIVESMTPVTASGEPEKYQLILTSKESAPTELLAARLYFYGEGTGSKRLFVDCEELKRSDTSRR
ncbi:MAG: hypothetical protein ABIR96_08615 [Bdellovibrionota bacterium]